MPQSIPVRRLRQMHHGKPIDLYVGYLPAEKLLRGVEVDVFHATENPSGYQREPVVHRVREIATYVSRNEGLLPTAMLVNVRSRGEFKADGVDDAGVLTIPGDEPLWLVDGQHRYYGLQMEHERVRAKVPSATLGYDVPVVFTLGLSREEEMDLFFVVNGKAKSVPTDLVAELLRRRVESDMALEGGRTTSAQQRRAVGVHVAYFLNGAPGPWQGRVRMPNELKTDVRTKPMQVNSIAASLEPALRDSWLERLYLTESPTEAEIEPGKAYPTLCRLVHTYWCALADLMPEAVASIQDHSLQRTAGVYSFHAILPDVLDRCRQRDNWSQAAMHELLTSLGEWGDGTTWHLVNGDPVTRSGGRLALKHITTEMRRRLPGLETPELPTI